MTKPRDYQLRAIEQMRAALVDARSVVYVLPTGGGKTVVFCEMIRRAAAKGKRALTLVHRVELLSQTVRALFRAGVVPGVLSAGAPPPQSDVVVAMIPTLSKRIKSDDAGLKPFDLVVVDEAHHAPADTYKIIVDAFPCAKIVGVTATPIRQDGKGLGDVFEKMVLGPSVRELIRDGYLSDFVVYAPKVFAAQVDFADGKKKKKKLYEHPVSAFKQRFGDEKTAIVFCESVKRCLELEKKFNAAGVAAKAVYGGMPEERRAAVLADLGDKKIKVVVSCNVVSEGVDVPSVDGVVLARPTESLALYLQQVGRALRVAPGKEKALIVDLVGNVLRHGMPDAEFVWTLQGVQKPPPREKQPGQTQNAKSFARETVLAKENERGLVEIDAQTLASMPYRIAISMLHTPAQLAMYAKLKGYKRGWVWHRMREMQAKQTEK